MTITETTVNNICFTFEEHECLSATEQILEEIYEFFDPRDKLVNSDKNESILISELSRMLDILTALTGNSSWTVEEK